MIAETDAEYHDDSRVTLVDIDFNKLLADQQRMKAVMNELEKSPDVILFIDELHTIVGAGGASGSLDASNMFKPALARGEISRFGTRNE